MRLEKTLDLIVNCCVPGNYSFQVHSLCALSGAEKHLKPPFSFEQHESTFESDQKLSGKKSLFKSKELVL